MELIIEVIAEHFSQIMIAIASIISAVLATYFTLKGQLKRDERNRLYEQRKIAYEKIVGFYMNILKEGEPKKINKKKIREETFNILKPLIIYGSCEVIEKYKIFQSLALKKVDGSRVTIYALEDILIEIRKELNPKENLEQGDLLSLFINDYKSFEN